MPELGEIKKAREIGKCSVGRSYIWQACENCGKERWVALCKEKPESIRCCKCAALASVKRGKEHSRWNGGRRKSNGYILIKLCPDDFFCSMCQHDGYVLEHRLVMAKHLHRCLLPWEVVHHRNGKRDDNRLENLELLPGQGKHNTLINKRIKELEKIVTKQSTQIKLLQWRISQLEGASVEINK